MKKNLLKNEPKTLDVIANNSSTEAPARRTLQVTTLHHVGCSLQYASSNFQMYSLALAAVVYSIKRTGP